MKISIRICAALLLLLLVFPLSACGGAPDSVSPPYDQDGNYTGFSDISDGYTAKDAVADGCVVIEKPLGIVGESAYGYEIWQAFLQKSGAGEDAFLRVTHFIDGTGYYKDLYYKDGRFLLFAYNGDGSPRSWSYPYLRRLEGTWADGERKGSCYVLTDDLDLTYYDVISRLASSDSSIAFDDSRFFQLGFPYYFERE